MTNEKDPDKNSLEKNKGENINTNPGRKELQEQFLELAEGLLGM